ncbi:MAG: hypothetical protein DHS20C03_01720 [Minwuia thermotolerans]|nr:MAG: hypothetical protein DHS20C03_01720 [Minwuia thermotolerans]
MPHNPRRLDPGSSPGEAWGGGDAGSTSVTTLTDASAGLDPAAQECRTALSDWTPGSSPGEACFVGDAGSTSVTTCTDDAAGPDPAAQECRTTPGDWTPVKPG